MRALFRGKLDDLAIRSSRILNEIVLPVCFRQQQMAPGFLFIFAQHSLPDLLRFISLFLIEMRLAQLDPVIKILRSKSAQLLIDADALIVSFQHYQRPQRKLEQPDVLGRLLPSRFEMLYRQ